jgi:hypothetical protein
VNTDPDAFVSSKGFSIISGYTFPALGTGLMYFVNGWVKKIDIILKSFMNYVRKQYIL